MLRFFDSQKEIFLAKFMSWKTKLPIFWNTKKEINYVKLEKIVTVRGCWLFGIYTLSIA